MRYRIKGGIVIKAENAAKSDHESSKYLLRILEGLPTANRSFDYGCGKLRYLKPILSSTETLVVVDSEVQLAREQILNSKKTSIRSLLLGSNRITVANPGQFRTFQGQFERGFCINVLSAIPIHSVRTRIIESIHRALVPGGSCVFVVQYRNSDFARMSKMSNAMFWRDGILVDSLRGHSFYALIPPGRLKSWVSDVGFEISDFRLHDGSIYLTARKHSPNEARMA